jgi:hypothetical protein
MFIFLKIYPNKSNVCTVIKFAEHEEEFSWFG